MKVKSGFGWFRRNSSQEDRSMPGKTRGGRTLAFPPAYPHTHKCPCENVGAEERSIRRGKGSVSATRSRLYLHSRKLSPPCTHCTVQLFAFLVLIRRRCYAGKGVHFPFETRGSVFHHHRRRRLLFLSLSLEKRQGRKGTMVMAKQRSTSRCSIENATNAAIKTKWWLVTRRLFSPPSSSLPSLFSHLWARLKVVQRYNTSFDICIDIIIVLP